MTHELKMDKRVKHQMAKKHPKEYAVWRGMKKRCFCKTSPAYKSYGGSGIKMEKEWVHSFDSFLSHVGPIPSKKHSIDRIENELGYIKGNVRWATSLVQSRNRSVAINIDGKTISDVSKKSGIRYATIYYRLKKGKNLTHKPYSNIEARGEKHHSSKITAQIAREIKTSQLPGAFFAKKYGISASSVTAIRKGRSWKAA